MRKILISALIAAIVGVSAPPVFAKKPDHAKGPVAAEAGNSAGKTVEEATQNVIERVFSEAERAIIEEYFGLHVQEKEGGDKSKGESGKKHEGLPPGLAKKDHLPPGLQKQLEKNGRLPPGLAKRDLPDDLLNRLPRPPHGTKRLIAGSDVVLVDATTELVLDVIHDAIRQ